MEERTSGAITTDCECDSCSYGANLRGTSIPTKEVIVERVIDTSPDCRTTVVEEPQLNSSPRLELIYKIRTLEEESLAQYPEIMYSFEG